ncbi:hypothetical protein [Sphingomonas japonica]|uniref:Uncharacterized protein n=1 Tax=Sphingomonas japonica TaxID=511662 RepID=A0ABX0U5T7_9SPHN|nr:hypothetical protein [Sphingomonas japonica]NIJ24153.1 hypothetical protein [Sphingomonas japonica]
MTIRTAALILPLAALLGACGDEADAPVTNDVVLTEPLPDAAPAAGAMPSPPANSTMTREQVSDAMASGDWNTTGAEPAPVNAQ